MAGLGILSLFSGDFALDWEPVPDGIPFRRFLAYVSGAILVTTGLGSLVPRAARAAMRALTIFMLLWVVLLRLPPVVAHPLDEGKWLGLGETTVLFVGGWITVLWITGQDRNPASPAAGKQLRIARMLYGLSLPAIGLSHLMYSDGTASLVPPWLPFRLAFAYLTGASDIGSML